MPRNKAIVRPPGPVQAPQPPATAGGVLAGKLRHLRRERQLTLQRLSERSGISTSALSKIEAGQLSPTYEKIAALAQALEVEVGDLFSPESADRVSGRRGVTRAGEGVMHVTPQYDYEMLCPELTGKQFQPIRARVKARSLATFGSLTSHAGEEFVYVLRGELHMHSEYYAPLVLRAGDSCYFDSRMGHALLSAGEDDAEILWVSSRRLLPESDAPPVHATAGGHPTFRTQETA